MEAASAVDNDLELKKKIVLYYHELVSLTVTRLVSSLSRIVVRIAATAKLHPCEQKTILATEYGHLKVAYFEL